MKPVGVHVTWPRSCGRKGEPKFTQLFVDAIDDLVVQVTKEISANYRFDDGSPEPGLHRMVIIIDVACNEMLPLADAFGGDL